MTDSIVRPVTLAARVKNARVHTGSEQLSIAERETAVKAVGLAEALPRLGQAASCCVCRSADIAATRLRYAALMFVGRSFQRRAGWVFVALASLCGNRVAAQAPPKHNVILFVADGLRRGSVTADDMPTFLALRTHGVDFANSHAVFPTFTTANASAIATGHGLGDTGDFSNVIWPGLWLTSPQATASSAGYVAPFLEFNPVLADLNSAYAGNYLGERTLLSAAREHGYAVASVGKLGPTAIQQNEAVQWNADGQLSLGDAIVVDDATGQATGLPLPPEILSAIEGSGLAAEAPLRTNGYGDATPGSNGFFGDAVTPGTHNSNRVQQQWMADVTTKVLLPHFMQGKKPFVLLFWSRDPDGSQHNEGDSLQQIVPGINGPTSKLGLRNADGCLKQLLDWLDAHPAVKAVTDVLVTSDHGFATISRREIAADGRVTGEPSAALDYELGAKEKAEPRGTLPTGFLAIDLAIREHLRAFDAGQRAVGGPSVYKELSIGGERSQYPEMGSALLGAKPVQKLDGSDAQLLIASNGGSDLIYAPTRDPEVVRRTLAVLSGLDYVGGLFVDDSFCGQGVAACPGALPLSSIGLTGSSKLPLPAIVVTFKVFYPKPGDLQSALQISDTNLQEGQGMHGGFGREQTWNNMAAIGPDFKTGFVDRTPVGNIDIAPTLAHILELDMPSVGKLRGRVAEEAFKHGETAAIPQGQVMVSAPAANGFSTVMNYQEMNGVRYYDRACFVLNGAKCTP